MAVLATWAPHDGVLGLVAPLGLAVAAGDCLVIDLDPAGSLFAGGSSLARLVADGPRRADLMPARRGLAVLCNGGVGIEAAWDVVNGLVRGWPAVVLRLAAHPFPSLGVPVVPIRPLLPGQLFPSDARPAVYQAAGWGNSLPGPGVVLPRPRPGSWAALLAGRLPRRDRWIRSWEKVWRMPWG